jgi:hypothetical protein
MLRSTEEMMPKQYHPPIGWMLLDLSFATVRRVAQVTADTCQEWKRVSQCSAKRREEEERDVPTKP